MANYDWLQPWLQRGLVSPSDMNSFLPESGCPLRWEFEKEGRAGIPTDDGRRLLGSNLHYMIRLYFQKISDKPSVDEIKRVAEGVYEEAFNERELSRLKRRAERCWKNFVDFELNRRRTWTVYKPTLVEEKKQNDEFICITDFHSDPMATTIDWKTGSLDQLKNDELRQGKVNQVVLMDNGHRSDRMLFVALYTGRVLEMPQVTRRWVEGEREKMIWMVKEGEFTKRVGPLCGWCAYQLDCEFSGVCLWI